MTVMQTLKEIRDDKTVVAVKEQPPCHNLRFALSVLFVGNIFSSYRQRKFPKDLYGNGEQMRFIQTLRFVGTLHKAYQLGKSFPDICANAIIELQSSAYFG